eukprot:symbB.v1.2.039067.t1/scaffold6323.1/size20174/1
MHRRHVKLGIVQPRDCPQFDLGSHEALTKMAKTQARFKKLYLEAGFPAPRDEAAEMEKVARFDARDDFEGELHFPIVVVSEV